MSSRILIAGGGVAALETLLALDEVRTDGAEVTVIAPEPRFTYRPLSILEAFRPGIQRSYALAELVHEAGGHLHGGRLVAVDPDRRIASSDDHHELPYDALVLAIGARHRAVVRGASTVGGPDGVASIRATVSGMHSGAVRRVAVVVPDGVDWSLPAYELALLFARTAQEADLATQVVVVTAEPFPLRIFGPEGERAARDALEQRGVLLREAAIAERFADGSLWIDLEGAVPVDAAFALPRPEGIPIQGVPADENGLIPVDVTGRVLGEDGLYAAGDITTFPVKQGGVAVQQADAVAASIAGDLGLGVEARPFNPVLRGVLVGGHRDQFLRVALAGGDTELTEDSPWWPASKIAGGRLAHHLAVLGP